MSQIELKELGYLIFLQQSSKIGQPESDPWQLFKRYVKNINFFVK